MFKPKWAALLLTIGLVLVIGCGESRLPNVSRDPTAVRIARPTVSKVTDYEEFPGHTDAVLNVQIKSRVTGYLLKKNFNDGDEAREGDVLYEIDDRPYKTALDRAESQAAKAEAHRNRLEADFHRTKNLYDRGAIGREEFDLVNSDFGEAEAALGASKASLDLARLNMSFTKVRSPMNGQLSRTLVDPGNLIREETTVLNDIVVGDKLYVYFDLDETALQKVHDLIELGRVSTKDAREVPVRVGTTVDFDRSDDARRRRQYLEGKARELNDKARELRMLIAEKRERGNKAGSKSSTTPGASGSSNLSKEPAKEASTPKAAQLTNDQERDAVRAELDAKNLEREAEKIVVPDEYPYPGLVNFSENRLDAATGTLRVRGWIENPSPSVLVPGLFVRVRLPIGEPHDALLVHESALGTDQGKYFVYVVDKDDEVEYRQVTVGPMHNGMRIVREGLKADDRIVDDAEGVRKVRPGTKVRQRSDQ